MCLVCVSLSFDDVSDITVVTVFELGNGILCCEHRRAEPSTKHRETSLCGCKKYKHSWNTARLIALVDRDFPLYKMFSRHPGRTFLEPKIHRTTLFEGKKLA